MSRDKQIEEMAWLKCHCHSNKGICGMDGKPCDLDCGSYHEAEALYNAGYHKASDVAREIFAEIIEALADEQIAEAQKADSALEAQDTASYEVYSYAEDKLGTIVLALSLCKKKYTENKGA